MCVAALCWTRPSYGTTTKMLAFYCDKESLSITTRPFGMERRTLSKKVGPTMPDIT